MCRVSEVLFWCAYDVYHTGWQNTDTHKIISKIRKTKFRHITLNNIAILIAELFTITNVEKEKIQYVCKMEHYSTIKLRRILSFLGKLKKLEDKIKSDKSDT